ncbi:MAG: site-specific integrase [Bacteroidales bacterium]|jgi:site-specific recombinase XerD
MKRSGFSVQFYAKRTKAKVDGTLPVFARIVVNGKICEFSLKQSVKPENWDERSGAVRGKTQEVKDLSKHIDFVKQRVLEIKRELEEQRKDVTPEGLRNKFLGIDEDNTGVLKLFDEHNEMTKKLVNRDFAEGTVERYQTCRKHLAEFMLKKYKRDEMPLKDINHQFITDFEFYLKTERTCCHNTTVKYIKNFKKIIRIAMANDLIKIDPFRNIKYHLDDVDLAYLNDEEINLIMKKHFFAERMRVVRDCYLFCCFTGLAFSDVKSLCPADLQQESDGSLWIKKKRRKTKNWCHIPVIAPAKEILDRYKENKACKEHNLCLPVMSNQKMNAYLKEIADVCGINKELSTHTARHTFATTVTLKNKVSIEVVSKMLGHSSINMTKKYARVVDDLIKTDMDKIMNKYSMNTPVLN